MKTQAMARAASSVSAWGQRIYDPGQLEACPKVGPEIRRVRPLRVHACAPGWKLMSQDHHGCLTVVH